MTFKAYSYNVGGPLCVCVCVCVCVYVCVCHDRTGTIHLVYWQLEEVFVECI